MMTQLAKLHQVELALLADIIHICENEKIPYFLIGGSLLGAIRHKGFIPWDDDIDVGFLRADYERFLQVAESHLTKQEIIITDKNTADYGMAFAKFAATNTEISEAQNLPNRSVHNVYIDLFPFDKIPASKLERKKQYIQFKILTKAILERLHYGQEDSWYKRIVVNLINICLASFSVKRLKQWRYRVATKYETDGLLDVINISSQYDYGREIMLKDEQNRLIQWQFEDLIVNVPDAYDTILTRMYHDYLRLPPKSEQKEKHLSTLMIDGEKID